MCSACSMRHTDITRPPSVLICRGEDVFGDLGAILIPKLRMQFAEFLNQSSLHRLRLLTLPTCVGLRYGHQGDSMRYFSWKWRLRCLRTDVLAHHLSALGDTAFVPTVSAFRLKPLSIARPAYLTSFYLTSQSSLVVQESQPASHRLRFSASA